MTARLTRIRPDTYVDSVSLMSATRAMQEAAGVEWAAALMGTSANLETIESEGFDRDGFARARANDVVLAVLASSTEQAEAGIQAGEARMAAGAGAAPSDRVSSQRPRSLAEAVAALPGANIAVVSVPGPYAALEAHHALGAGLHVLLFSDNVPLEDEVDLKARGERLGRLVMGPGAGTAMLAGVGLGFANVARAGPVGVVAAAGTGAQEVMSLLTRWGAGVSHVIGVGGRDVSQAVGGRMARLAIGALQEDPDTHLILLVSKPPDAAVASDLLRAIAGKAAVAALIGLDHEVTASATVRVVRTMEEAVIAALEALGLAAPDPGVGLEERVTATLDGLSPMRTAIRGLFSGGTLCYEAMVILSRHVGAVHSNTPLHPGWGLPAPPGSHVCLDLGEEEYTRGRPHPMIDPQARLSEIRRAAADPGVAVIMLDIVLGYGGHPDPAGALAPACREVTARPDGPRVIAYILGTDEDPQNFTAQQQTMAASGCLLAPTAARAALMAGAIAARQPALAAGSP